MRKVILDNHLRYIQSDISDLYDENKELNKEIKRLKEEYVMLQNASDKVEEEKDEEIERLNNIINIILDFNLFKDECPLCLGYLEKCDEEKAQDVFYEDDYCEKTCNDNYKKCWLKYFERLQELKGSDSNE